MREDLVTEPLRTVLREQTTSDDPDVVADACQPISDPLAAVLERVEERTNGVGLGFGNSPPVRLIFRAELVGGFRHELCARVADTTQMLDVFITRHRMRNQSHRMFPICVRYRL